MPEVRRLGRCTAGNEQMLPTHEGSQIPRKIFRDVRDIVRCSHTLHGTERLYELSELCFDAIIIIDTRTFDCCREDAIHGDASVTDFLR